MIGNGQNLHDFCRQMCKYLKIFALLIKFNSKSAENRCQKGVKSHNECCQISLETAVCVTVFLTAYELLGHKNLFVQQSKLAGGPGWALLTRLENLR